ncbi:methionyl-tRNA formyltransferase [Rubellicoccus peritrichatus]|uniref:Methionyl-tRNA formyltransferase n=1 Tax=Rubellicoccus peritrichatus TaxID=3080537 RepID=A0AAQ3L8V1_9BACT|nr:methionyl-tRNA formyltransferase [Puniceicoccus sp. CR14]WOO40976.1 methionyl-tRNA formyltransferase [Puniceicoccus sp. CR14]
MVASRKFVFMGSDAIALPLLDWLHKHAVEFDAELVSVFSQPDRPKGRGRKLQPNPISAWALEKGVDLHRPEKPDADTIEYFKSNDIQLALVMAYGHLLRRALLATPPRGFVNFHASLLPKYRGASPVESAVASGEHETGVSLMEIIPAMDAGPVCDVERVSINASDTGHSTRGKLATACVPLIARNLEALLNGSASFVEQTESDATYCRKLSKTDGLLDFSVPAETLAARINGLDPWPGCFCDHRETRIKLREASFVKTKALADVGTVIGFEEGKVCIATGDGVLRIACLQRPGGRMLPAIDFLRGYELSIGAVLSGGPMEPLSQDRPFKR